MTLEIWRANGSLTGAGMVALADPPPDDLQAVGELDRLLIGQLGAVVGGGDEAILVRLVGTLSHLFDLLLEA